MTVRPDNEIAKATAGFWNAAPYDAATNPGGMDEAIDGSVAGHVDNFPAAVAAVGKMTLWTGEQAAAAGAAREQAVAAHDVVLPARDAAVSAAAAAVEAAALVRGLPYRRADGSTARVVTVSGAQLPYRRADGSAAAVNLT